MLELMWLVPLAFAGSPDLAALDAAAAQARAVPISIRSYSQPGRVTRADATAKSAAVRQALAAREAAVAKVEALAAAMEATPEVAVRVARAHADLISAIPPSSDDFTRMAIADVSYAHEDRIRAVLENVPPSLDGQRLLQDQIDHPERQSFPRCFDQRRSTREAIPTFAAKLAHLEADVNALAGCADVELAETVIEQARPVVVEHDESMAADMTSFVDDAIAQLDAAFSTCNVPHPSVPPVPPVVVHETTVCVTDPWRAGALARFDPLERETAEAKDAAALIRAARGWLDASQDLWAPQLLPAFGTVTWEYEPRTSAVLWAALRADQVLDEARARGGGDEAERVQASVLRWRAFHTRNQRPYRTEQDPFVPVGADELLPWMTARMHETRDAAGWARLALVLDDVDPPLGAPHEVGALIADAAKRLSRRAAANAVDLDPATPMGIRLRAWSLWAAPAPPEPEGLATERDRVRTDLARAERCRDPEVSAKAAAILAAPEDELQVIRLLLVHPDIAVDLRRCPAPVGPWTPPPPGPFSAEAVARFDTLFDAAPEDPRSRAIAVARGAERILRAGSPEWELSGPAVRLMAWSLAEADGNLEIEEPGRVQPGR